MLGSLRYSNAFASSYFVDCTTVGHFRNSLQCPLNVSVVGVAVCCVRLRNGMILQKAAEGSKMPSSAIESCQLSQLRYKVLQSDKIGAGSVH
jgi:hypothetical protein